MIVSCGSLQCSAVWPVPNCNSNRLKHIQNATFHLITLTAKHDHITPVLFNIHWHPLNHYYFQDFPYSLQGTLLFNTFVHMWCACLHPILKSRQLRSSPKHLLLTLSYNLKTYCARSFSMAAPTLWNALPFKIRNSLSVFVLKKRNSKCFCLRSLLAIYFRLMFFIFS